MTTASLMVALILTPSLGSSAHPGPLADVPDAEVLAGAEHAFGEGVAHRGDSDAARPKFREAARGYDELWGRGHHNPALALDRARAHRLAGDLPGSIAAFHDGLAVARYDRRLQAGLEDARNAVQYPLEGDLAVRCRPRPGHTIGTRMSCAEAYIAAGIGWALVCCGLVRYAITRLPGALVFSGVWIVALGLLGGLWASDWRRVTQENALPRVIVVRDVVLRRGNGDAYPPRLDARLPAGVEARERTRRGGWVQVELTGGDVGWLPETVLLEATRRE
jgi:hypothetical protein